MLEDALHVPRLLIVRFVNQGIIKPLRISVILAIHYAKHVMVLLKHTACHAIKVISTKITNV